ALDDDVTSAGVVALEGHEHDAVGIAVRIAVAPARCRSLPARALAALTACWDREREAKARNTSCVVVNAELEVTRRVGRSEIGDGRREASPVPDQPGINEDGLQVVVEEEIGTVKGSGRTAVGGHHVARPDARGSEQTGH